MALWARAPRPAPSGVGVTQTIVLRFATIEDEPDLRRLAALDSQRLVPGAVLMAFVDGDLRAAVDVATGRAYADPFAPTADLVDLLRDRVARLRRSAARAALPERLCTFACLLSGVGCDCTAPARSR